MAQPLNPKRRSLPLPDWRSGLPEDLPESIGQRLTSGHDAASFRSACSPWHAAVPFATFGPLLLLPFDPDSDHVGFYCVPEKKILSKTLPDVRGKVACGSSCGWLALMDKMASVTLLNPFCPPDAADRECVAMAMLACSTEVAFCRVGVDSAWTLLDSKLEFFMGSIVHCQDKFLTIDCTGEIFVCSSNAADATLAATLLPSL
ncbi:putative F-box protein At5g55150 [Miscanthus floridulus]|uniref:putative F-box protein At5g55150 n=1 Tax=Miscanthus floridulus TaxID=154761 RepID=UPI00345A1469